MSIVHPQLHRIVKQPANHLLCQDDWRLDDLHHDFPPLWSLPPHLQGELEEEFEPEWDEIASHSSKSLSGLGGSYHRWEDSSRLTNLSITTNDTVNDTKPRFGLSTLQLHPGSPRKRGFHFSSPSADKSRHSWEYFFFILHHKSKCPILTRTL